MKLPILYRLSCYAISYLTVFALLLFNPITAKSQNLLCNGSFDNVPVGSPPAFVTNANMPCWYTSSPDSLFEVWTNGFNGIPSYTGNQFIEMNANYASNIWQEFNGTPGLQVKLSFAHRGRGGTDSVGVYIAPAGGPDSLIGIYGDAQVWGYHTVYFTLPYSVANYTLKFTSHYYGLGLSTVGNILDAVTLDTGNFVPNSTFTASNTTMCPMQCVDFTDQSSNNPTSWQWLFPGADVTSSIQQNPVNICYSNSGTYDVTLITCNAAGCDTLLMPGYITVFANPVPLITLTNDTLLCTPAASYQWYNVPGGLITGATDSFYLPNQNGDFYVMITDSNGCTGTSDTLTVNTITPVAGISCTDTSLCEKHCIDFTDLTSNNPTTWLWFFPGADTLVSTQQNPTGICYSTYGSFDVMLISCNPAGCDTLYLPGFINVYPAPVPAVTIINDTLFSSPGVSYQWWSVDSGLISGATNNYYIPTYAGSFFVVVTDSNGCNGASNTVVITGINNPVMNNGNITEIAIVPNPNNGHFNIEFNDDARVISLKVYSITGQQLFENTANHKLIRHKSISTSLENLTPGIYFVEVTTPSKVIIQKFMVE